MKNIDKYPNTKDALEAYTNEDIQRVPFGIWLDCESEEPREPTLLEAAEKVVDEYTNPNSICIPYYNTMIISDLRSALAREKQKPVRNCDRYATAKEANVAFLKMCNKYGHCTGCPFESRRNKEADCLLLWGYDEAGKEAE